MKTEQEIRQLKAEWAENELEGITDKFDLSEFEGFEDHKEELAQYQKNFREREKARLFLKEATKQQRGSSYCLKVKLAIMKAIETLDLDELDGDVEVFDNLISAKRWLKSAIDYIGYHESNIEHKKMIANEVI